jgi:hypothetical protein
VALRAGGDHGHHASEHSTEIDSAAGLHHFVSHRNHKIYHISALYGLLLSFKCGIPYAFRY